MANLTGNYGKLRKSIYASGAGKEELKALENLPNKAQLLAAFQSFEDFITSNVDTLKTNMDVALGIKSTQSLFKKMFVGYLSWKMRNI